MVHVLVLLCLLLLLLFLITRPLRWGWKILLNTLCGFGCLIILNLLEPFTGMLFELNLLTCAVAGALGLPGLGALLIVHCVLGV